MRFLTLYISLILLLVGIVACTPTEENSTPTDEITAEGTQEATPDAFVIVTRSFEEPTPEGALDIPAPGEFVASETEDPDANILFDRIYLVRTGEVNGESVRDEIEIFPNGRYTRNGSGGLITPDEIATIQGHIVETNFFGIQGSMLGPTADTPDYRYQLSIERSGIERMIQSHDGFMPPAYRMLLAEILLVTMR